MDDLISRQAAIDAIKELCLHYTPTKSVDHPHMNFVIEELEGLPTAQPELLKSCKNCIHLGHAYMMPCKNCRRNQMMPDWYEVENER